MATRPRGPPRRCLTATAIRPSYGSPPQPGQRAAPPGGGLGCVSLGAPRRRSPLITTLRRPLRRLLRRSDRSGLVLDDGWRRRLVPGRLEEPDGLFGGLEFGLQEAHLPGQEEVLALESVDEPDELQGDRLNAPVGGDLRTLRSRRAHVPTALPRVGMPTLCMLTVCNLQTLRSHADRGADGRAHRLHAPRAEPELPGGAVLGGYLPSFHFLALDAPAQRVHAAVEALGGLGQAEPLPGQTGIVRTVVPTLRRLLRTLGVRRVGVPRRADCRHLPRVDRLPRVDVRRVDSG